MGAVIAWVYGSGEEWLGCIQDGGFGDERAAAFLRASQNRPGHQSTALSPQLLSCCAVVSSAQDEAACVPHAALTHNSSVTSSIVGRALSLDRCGGRTVSGGCRVCDMSCSWVNSTRPRVLFVPSDLLLRNTGI